MFTIQTTNTTWQYIIHFDNWKLNDKFMQCTFNDGLILVIPFDQIVSILQLKK